MDGPLNQGIDSILGLSYSTDKVFYKILYFII
jgi:hypothetical protein